MSDFLNNLKEGDLVVIDHGFDNIRVSSVTRATKTQILIGDVRFSRRDGCAIGQRHFMSRHFLREPTPEIVEKIKRASAIDKLRHTDFKDVSTENLVKAIEALGI